LFFDPRCSYSFRAHGVKISILTYCEFGSSMHMPSSLMIAWSSNAFKAESDIELTIIGRTTVAGQPIYFCIQDICCCIYCPCCVRDTIYCCCCCCCCGGGALQRVCSLLHGEIATRTEADRRGRVISATERATELVIRAPVICSVLWHNARVDLGCLSLYNRRSAVGAGERYGCAHGRRGTLALRNVRRCYSAPASAAEYCHEHVCPRV